MNRQERRRQKKAKTTAAGRSPDLLVLLKQAMENHRQGRLPEAVGYYRQALKVDANCIPAHNNLASALKELGRTDEAVQHYARTLELNPDSAECHYNLGVVLEEEGELELAFSHYNAALVLEPAYATARFNLANVLLAQENFEAAIAQYEKVLEQVPDNVDASNNVGIALQRTGNLDRAEACFRNTLALAPGFAKGHNNLGNVLKEVERFDEAIESFNQSIEIDPDYAEAYYNRGLCYLEQELFDDALENFDKALELKADYAESHYDRGNTLRDMGRFDDAIDSYTRAMERKSDYAEACNNLGILLKEREDFADAEVCFRRAMEMQPDYADAHTNLSCALFMRGKLEEGWREYEWRQKPDSLQTSDRHFPQPLWDGSPLQGKSIILWGEQGLGDEIRYASMIPDLMEDGARIVIECTDRLVDLFSRSFVGADVRARPFAAGELGSEEFDFHCPIPSLGRFLRPDIGSFPKESYSYLKADPERQRFWLERLEKLSGGPRIGLVWRSMKTSQLRDRYYASIDDLAPVFSLEGVEFINLMYGECQDDLAHAKDCYGVTIHTWDDLDLRDDIDGVAALMANLDIVLSPFSAVGDLAGGLGKEAITFVGENNHYVMMGTGQAIWYPETRFFTKSLNDPWGTKFEDIRQELVKKFDLTG